MRARCPARCARYPIAPETDPGTNPRVLETFAVTGGTPNASKVGKVINVPDPTTVLMVPAATPPSRITASCTSERSVVTPRSMSAQERRQRGQSDQHDDTP